MSNDEMTNANQVYYFSVHDPEPECLTFGCVAVSLDEAKSKAAAAGFHEVLLLEVRDLRGAEISRVANDEFIENPFLGAAWLPLVDELAAAVEDMKVGSFFALHFLARAYDFDSDESPYIQGMFEADGSLHLEIGSPQIIAALREKDRLMLEHMGWSGPAGGIPNHSRIFEPGWNIRHVAYVALQTLVVSLKIDTTDIVLPAGPGLKKFGQLGLLDRLDETNGVNGEVGFGLKGLHALSGGQRNITNRPVELEPATSEPVVDASGSSADADSKYYPTSDMRAGGFKFDGDEPEEGEEPVYYGGSSTFANADVIFDRLFGAGLVDSRAKYTGSDDSKHSDENGVCLRGQAKKVCPSTINNDDVTAYVIDVEVWARDEKTRRSWTSFSHEFDRARVANDPRALALIVGDNWAVWIRRGAKDGRISSRYAVSTWEALGQGVILWAKPAPEPAFLEPRYKDASAIVEQINERLFEAIDDPGFDDVFSMTGHALLANELKKLGASDYVANDDDNSRFMSVLARVAWRNSGVVAQLRVDVLTTQHWRRETPRWMEVYFPVAVGTVYVADDGWVIRIVDAEEPQRNNHLLVAAGVIQSIVGGSVYAEVPA